MDGNDIRTKFICLQDIARNSVETLLMSYVGKWNGDCPHRPNGSRLHNFLKDYNNKTQLKFGKELHREPMVPNNGLFVQGSTDHFVDPIALSLLDITALCKILDQDIPQFAVRSAQYRRDGVHSKITCNKPHHNPSTCSQHSMNPQNTKQKQKGKKCNKTLTECIEETAACCDTCKTCHNCRARLRLPSCNEEGLRKDLQKIREFRNLVAHKTPDAYEALLTNTFIDNKFPNCSDFEGLWNDCVLRVKNLLDYLLYNKSITQIYYNDTLVEFLVIHRKPSEELLKLYGHAIAMERMKNMKLELDFGMREVKCLKTNFRKLLGKLSHLFHHLHAFYKHRQPQIR